MGAYLVCFPRVRVRMFFWFVVFYRVVAVPAWAVLGWWFVFQVLMGLPQLARAGAGDRWRGGWAHIGGFVAGVALVRWFARPDLLRARRAMLLRRGLLDHLA